MIFRINREYFEIICIKIKIDIDNGSILYYYNPIKQMEGK